MSNLLAIPFKKTYQIDIAQAARDYISNQAGGHPDEFRNDIKSWRDLRNEATGGTVHTSRIDSALLYHAQLTAILAKFPSDIQLAIPYSTAFSTDAIPLSLNSLLFERASVVFNLGALYSQLANVEDRSSTEGIKRAAAYYQQSAGSFAYLKSVIQPQLATTITHDLPPDLSDGTIAGFEYLMLAQAQECSWQMAKLNNYKNALISKIAARVSNLYESAFMTLSESARRFIPKDWLTHVQVKAYHFKAVAEFRKSFDEIENGSQYGLELARLGNAQGHAQQACEIARRGRVSTPVTHDAQSLLETIQKSVNRAQRDNDLIYHQDVPAPSAVPAIQETNLVASRTPPGLSNPESVLKSTVALFSGLVSWGAKEAINIYEDRKRNLLQEQVQNVVQELYGSAEGQLRSMNLPASLEALERPIGLPPSLLRKADEVREEKGPDRIEASLENIEILGERARKLLDEAMDILDTEASEDESTRKDYPITRPPSHEANIELTNKGERYRHILDQARDSDESVRQKWYDWEEHIRQLTFDEATLDSMVPSTTTASVNQTTPQARLTRKHARALRVKLEDLDALQREGDDVVRRVRTVVEVDDIQPRIMKAAAGFEKLATVQPVMFEDISDEELSKYDKYLQELAELAKRQENLLQEIKVDNEQLLRSRKEDPAVKDRELALQALELAYLKYKELRKNLDEGNKFYNNLSDILMQFKAVCKAWALQRNQELHELTDSFKNMSLHSEGNRKSPVTPGPPSLTQAKTPGKPNSSRLPPLTSAEWGFEDIPLPPGPKTPAAKSRR